MSAEESSGVQLQVSDRGEPIEVSARAFGRDFNRALVHQAVTAYLAGARQGTSAQKTRAATRGGGAKPWRQKGTGRARAGSVRSPLWRGGGVIFPAQPRSYRQKLNKKMYRAAMGSILSELTRQSRLTVVDAFSVDAPRTRELLGKLKGLELERCLIVTDEADENLYLAARNLPGVDVCEVGGLDPVSLVRFEQVLITVAAVKQLEAWLG